MRDKWFLSADTLKHKIRHLAGHKRLGPTHTKCGKLLGGVISGDQLEPCQVCEAELLMEGKGSFPHSRSKDLRDEFAMAALASIVRSRDNTFLPEDDAEFAFKVADAMMAEREKRG
jgi:hypothetical protein